ncbi:Gelsolin domain-containing protein/VHP domain-containing protein, partial [Cephalotus follicularis]
GLEIWCIENHQLVPVTKSSHGKFYSGSAYIVLNTILLKDGPPQHDIHYWLGKDANEMDSALASEKALEIDAALGSCTVQYREVQGIETEMFLSYFRPCIIPIEGVYSSQTGDSNVETYKVSLLTCKGDHAVYVKEVPFTRTSLNHNDVFVLDTASKIFLFSGCNSSIQERAKALEVVQYIKENKHNGNCEVATVEDGKFVGDADVGEFWSFFGGYAPIPNDSPYGVQKQSDSPSVKFFWITTQGKLCQSGTDSLNKEMLDTSKCYMLDCDTEIFVWMGRGTSLTERKTTISATEDFLRNHDRSSEAHLTFITEGLETAIFRSYFDSWPQTVEPRLYEEGREKVAAMFKQQGYDVKELPEEDSFNYVIHMQIGLDVRLIVGLLQGIVFFGGNLVPGKARNNMLFLDLVQRLSIEPWLIVHAISHMNAIAISTKADRVLAQIVEGKEPPLFFLILQILVVFKGGVSTAYKKFITEKGIEDETYDGKRTALFRVQGTGPKNMQAIQVDQVSSSLNSSYCYILQNEESVFTWIGNLSLTRDHDLLDRMVEFINPMWQTISVREGSEPDSFWNALGGKAEYPRDKRIKGHTEDPNLFLVTSREGDFKVKEIYNFTQDDLTTEDILVLVCHTEIYLWVGSHSNVGSKQQALSLGLKFLEMDILFEGLSSETPIYVVMEGQEPQFFTRFFEWDSSKANMHGNSFERKLAILKGKTQNFSVPVRNSRKAHSMGSTPDSLRSKSVSSNGRGSSLSPAPNSGFNLRSFNNHLLSSPTPIIKKLFSGSSPNHGSSGSPSTQQSAPSESANVIQRNGSEAGVNSLIYPYERLTVLSTDPVKGIDVTKRETYLSQEEFEDKFGMTKSAFNGLPKWKQNKLKMSIDLF